MITQRIGCNFTFEGQQNTSHPLYFYQLSNVSFENIMEVSKQRLRLLEFRKHNLIRIYIVAIDIDFLTIFIDSADSFCNGSFTRKYDIRKWSNLAFIDGKSFKSWRMQIFKVDGGLMLNFATASKNCSLRLARIQKYGYYCTSKYTVLVLSSAFYSLIFQFINFKYCKNSAV